MQIWVYVGLLIASFFGSIGFNLCPYIYSLQSVLMIEQGFQERDRELNSRLREPGS